MFLKDLVKKKKIAGKKQKLLKTKLGQNNNSDKRWQKQKKNW